VGIIVFAKAKFIKVIHSLDIQRTQSLSAEADVEQIQMNLLVFESSKYQRRGPIIDGYSVLFSVADCPAQFRNPPQDHIRDVTTWKNSQRLL
jgi:hypothetical protein